MHALETFPLRSKNTGEPKHYVARKVAPEKLKRVFRLKVN